MTPLALLAALLLTVSGTGVAVTDGDTLTVLVDGEQLRVRIWGIDAPERGDPFSDRSRDALADMTLEQTVTLEVTGRDRYRRTIAHVFTADGTDVGVELVRRGLAWHYVQYAPNDTELAAAQLEAQRERVGVWTLPNPVPPWERRAERREGRDGN